MADGDFVNVCSNAQPQGPIPVEDTVTTAFKVLKSHSSPLPRGSTGALASLTCCQIIGLRNPLRQPRPCRHHFFFALDRLFRNSPPIHHSNFWSLFSISHIMATGTCLGIMQALCFFYFFPLLTTSKLFWWRSCSGKHIP